MGNDESWSGKPYMIFPSDDDSHEARGSSDNNKLFPSDSENNSDRLTVQGATSLMFNDVGSTLAVVSNC